MGRPRITIEVGNRFGRLTVIQQGGRDRWNHPLWECRCDCGVTTFTTASHLKLGRSTSCRPCGHQRHGATRGGRFTPEYKIWKGMIQRCHNPKCGGYPLYGARGIHVSEQWRGEGGFERFFSHIGPKPSPKHEIDRIDSTGNYEPGNVRWATRKEQSRNLRRHNALTVNGITKKLYEWADETGLTISTILNRIRRGWSPERCIEVVKS